MRWKRKGRRENGRARKEQKGREIFTSINLLQKYM
jgi:hypothetical protein